MAKMRIGFSHYLVRIIILCQGQTDSIFALEGSLESPFGIQRRLLPANSGQKKLKICWHFRAGSFYYFEK